MTTSRSAIIFVALLAAACSTSSPNPTGPSGEMSAHVVAPRANVRLVLPAYSFGPATPDGFPLSGQVVNWGNTCAKNVTGTSDLLGFGGDAVRLTWSIPGLIQPGASASFVACCGPLTLADHDGEIRSHVQTDSGC